MMRVSLQQIASILGAQPIGGSVEIDDVATDTRKLQAGCLFVSCAARNSMGTTMPRMH